MLIKHDVPLNTNPQCTTPIVDLGISDFNYYDKDGFELNKAEQKYYHQHNYPIDHPILNHCCWQEPWFEINHPTLIIDHSMILHRCSYNGEALKQLNSFKNHAPLADLVINTKQKWGFDFALDVVCNGKVYEVLHIEVDHNNLAIFESKLIRFENIVEKTDWVDAADKIVSLEDHWGHLSGMEQNNWKAKFLLGWDRAEYTEKASY
jgi:hypothetical protein